MKLTDKVALITGGNSGIGAATAKLFAAEGAAVTIVGRNETRGNRVLQEIQSAGGPALFVACDVRRAAEVRRAVQWTVREFGRLDILFNNAGIILRKNVVDMTEEEWDTNLD
ncbi:MAG: SDR family NAD(P)-dependent oxidoreductase, partial [Chloroflexi bacterium]|nr:SDR family NAD(P)-dependent oxidoreductase [Chloroflexota bacterium]